MANSTDDLLVTYKAYCLKDDCEINLSFLFDLLKTSTEQLGNIFGNASLYFHDLKNTTYRTKSFCNDFAISGLNQAAIDKLAQDLKSYIEKECSIKDTSFWQTGSGIVTILAIPMCLILIYLLCFRFACWLQSTENNKCSRPLCFQYNSADDTKNESLDLENDNGELKIEYSN